MIGDYLVWCLVLARMCALARQNARSDRVCLDFSLLRFFVSRQRNEEERQMKEKTYGGLTFGRLGRFGRFVVPLRGFGI
jgi:hypothetical protein